MAKKKVQTGVSVVQNEGSPVAVLGREHFCVSLETLPSGPLVFYANEGHDLKILDNLITELNKLRDHLARIESDRE